jgi:hypothetical protein
MDTDGSAGGQVTDQPIDPLIKFYPTTRGTTIADRERDVFQPGSLTGRGFRVQPEFRRLGRFQGGNHDLDAGPPPCPNVVVQPVTAARSCQKCDPRSLIPNHPSDIWVRVQNALPSARSRHGFAVAVGACHFSSQPTYSTFRNRSHSARVRVGGNGSGWIVSPDPEATST